MGLLLNVLLLVLGSVATLAAFGGKTWTEGTEPLYRRITRRGWLSVSCLALALSLGILKEVRADQGAAALKQERDVALQKVEEANTKLGHLGSQLNDTRAHLSRQSQVNLITALSRGSSIEDGSWVIDFNGSAAQAPDLITYLVSPIPDQFRGVARVELSFDPFMGIHSRMVLSMDGDQARVDQPDLRPGSPSPPAKLIQPDFLVRPPDMPQEFWEDEREDFRLRSRTKSSFILAQVIGAGEGYRSAAIAIRDLARRPQVASLTLKFEKMFATEAEARAFVAGQPRLRGTGRMTIGTDGVRVQFAIPADVAGRVSDYWRQAITGSSAHLYLDDDETHLMISSRLGLKDIKIDRFEVTGSFHAVSDPEISVGIEEI